MRHRVVSPSSNQIIGVGAAIFTDKTETMLTALDQQMAMLSDVQKLEGLLSGDNIIARQQIGDNQMEKTPGRTQVISDPRDTYPDLYIPVAENYRIIDQFCGYSDSLSTDNNPMILVELEGLSYQYGTSIYAVDRVNGTMYGKFSVGYRIIHNHCDAHNFIPDYQSTNRPNYSCEMALVKITNDILWAMEHQKATNLMAIDLLSAFDTVDFGCLTQVLQDRFGVKGKALCWFENYLHPRFCKVNVGCTYSSDRELKCSVPQGSCVGPILYTVYASTLEEVVCGPGSELLSPNNDSLIPKIDLHGFADDHALKNSFKAGDLEAECTCISTLESTAGNVKTWMDQNHLKMNDEKTEFIVFASHQLLPKCETKTLHVNRVNVE